MSTTKNSKFKSAIAVLLMLAIVITGAFAYLTAQDGKKNVFTIGNIDLELVEEDWADVDGDGDFEHNDGLNENILPGHKIPKAPYVKNTGSKAAYTYVTVGVPTMQKDPSRPDSLAVSFSNTSIPVVAYGVQEGYGKVTGSENIWNAYYVENVAEKFGNEVTDEAELLNRVELFELSELGSGWSQLGDAYKSADGFNYYVFAYENTEPTLAADAETTKVFEYVVLNRAITESQDVLFSPDTSAVNYYVKSDIGEDKAEEIYGVDTDYIYSGAIENDYVPEEGDGYYISNADVILNYNSTSSNWEVEASESNPIDEDLIPKTILNKQTAIIDPQADPDPDRATLELGEVYQDNDYEYKYGYKATYSYDYASKVTTFNWAESGVEAWGVRATDTTKSVYGPMKNAIYGKPVTNLDYAFRDCVNLTKVEGLSKNATSFYQTFYGCTSLVEPPILPESADVLKYTFNGCTALKSMPTIPNNVTDLMYTFYGCASLVNITEIPDSVIYMDGTFKKCASLSTSPELPPNITTLYDTFSGCTNLIEAPIIPEKVTSLSQTFFECESLTVAPEIPDSVTSMQNTFWFAGIKEAPVLPPRVTNLAGAFEGTPIVTPPVIPNGVTSLSYTFAYCPNLTSMPTIPNSVTNMRGTFESCTKLTEVTSIPSKVNEMISTFAGCTALVEPPYMSYNTSLLSMQETFRGCTSLEYAPSIPERVSTLNNTFLDCTSLKRAPSLPSSLRDMYGAFQNCTSLTGTITIPQSVYSMSYSFKGTSAPITLRYYSACTVAANYSAPSNVTKVCIDA